MSQTSKQSSTPDEALDEENAKAERPGQEASLSQSQPDAAPVTASHKKRKSKKGKAQKQKLPTSNVGTDTKAESSQKVVKRSVDQRASANAAATSNELAGMDHEKLKELMKSIDLSNLLSDMNLSKKKQQDMGPHKFWQTQPVPKFDELGEQQEGPIKVIDPETIPKDPPPMLDGFEWVTLDLDDENEVHEVFDLLANHYVEDDDAMFRFKYSPSFLNWALKAPGWRKEWHVGVRVQKSHKLVAFISGIPISLRIRSTVLQASEINFLCIHKKLRSKRLAPVLIREITRRCNVAGIFQAIYTVGMVLPKPVSSCRYYHRALDWLKLYEVGFSPLPSRSTKNLQIAKYRLPAETSTAGLRPIEQEDLAGVKELLKKYLERFDLAPQYTKEELDHWLIPKSSSSSDSDHEQVVWTYVVEDPSSHEITDCFSFYCLESSVIGNTKHKNVRAAYLFYYASNTAFEPEESGLADRLNQLMHDALILAKNAKFDVFNALTLMDNPLFLEKQKFGAGDGMLHFYLYNWWAKHINGGINDKNLPDPDKRGGVALAML